MQQKSSEFRVPGCSWLCISFPCIVKKPTATGNSLATQWLHIFYKLVSAGLDARRWNLRCEIPRSWNIVKLLQASSKLHKQEANSQNDSFGFGRGHLRFLQTVACTFHKGPAWTVHKESYRQHYQIYQVCQNPRPTIPVLPQSDLYMNFQIAIATTRRIRVTCRTWWKVILWDGVWSKLRRGDL